MNILKSVCIAAFLVVGAQASGFASESDATAATAAEHRDWDSIASLIQRDADVMATQPDGMTALHWAVFHDEPNWTQRLIDAGCDVNAKTLYGVTPLSIACTAGSGELVDRLIAAGAKVDYRAAGGETVLMIAARTGEVAPVVSLIRAGADVNAADENEQTALMWAAAEGNTQVVDALIQAGADTNVTLTSGFTAMMFAAREGRIATAMRLLDAGVDVNIEMKPKRSTGRAPRSGMSALMLAIESGHFELAIELIKRGADPNDERSEFTPLHAIVFTRKTSLGDGLDGDPIPRGSGRLSSLDFVRQAVELGADVNRQLRRGNGGRAKLNLRSATPFLMAAKNADLPLLQLLLELGADPTLTNIDSTTPIMAAAGIGVTAVGEEPGTETEVIETMRWLVGLGADVNLVDRNGETAMHGAAYRNYPLAVHELASLGANPEIWDRKNKYGWTPTMIAEGNRPGSFKPSPETIAALAEAKTMAKTTATTTIPTAIVSGE